MSELPHRRGRRLAAPAVAFLLPARHDTPLVFQTTKQQTCAIPHRQSWISSAPTCPDNIAARPLNTGTGSTRRLHLCFGGGGGGGGGALFAAAATREGEDKDAEPHYCLLSAQRQINTEVRGDPTDDGDRLPGDSERISGRITEPRGPNRWERLRSTSVARALGRVFRGRGRSGLVEEYGMDDTLNSVVSGQQRLPADRGRGDGLLSPFRAWRRQRPDQTHADPADGPLAENTAGREDRGEDFSEGEQESLHESRDVAAAAAAAAAAGSVVGGGDVVSGAAVDDSSRRASAKYDGEEVLPETWAKVDELRARAQSSDPTAGEEERGLHAWLATGGEGRAGLTDTDLLRFVMFRNGDVDVAWQQLKQAAAWRQERRVEDVLCENPWSRHEELQAEMFWLGRDVDGRPTIVLRSIAHHPGAIDSEDFQRYLLFLLEQGRQLWGLGSEQQLNIVVDRVGAGIKNQDPQLMRTMLPVFRDAYPDIIYRCYVAPSSWIFRFVWIIAARLVDERQRKRVLLLVGEWQSGLLEAFDPSVLPPHLGGTMSDYPPKQPPDMTWHDTT